MGDRTCSIDGCEIPHYARGWCYLHYARWRKHGSTDYPTKPPMPECIIDGCERVAQTRKHGLCSIHHGRWKRLGDPLALFKPRKPQPRIRASRRDDIGYVGAHGRVTRDRGKAATHNCVDCGEQAYQWSYGHGCAKELVSADGKPYCPHPEHYSPRCVSCHKRYDRDR